MKHVFTIVIAAGTLAVATFASTVTSSGLAFTQAGAAHGPVTVASLTSSHPTTTQR